MERRRWRLTRIETVIIAVICRESIVGERGGKRRGDQLERWREIEGGGWTMEER